MAMLAINADLGTLKTGLTLTAVPFLFLLVVQVWGLIRWLQEDSNRIDMKTGLLIPVNAKQSEVTVTPKGMV